MNPVLALALTGAVLGLSACAGFGVTSGATPAGEAAKILDALDKFDQRCAKTVHFTAAIGAGAGGAISVDKNCPAATPVGGAAPSAAQAETAGRL